MFKKFCQRTAALTLLGGLILTGTGCSSDAGSDRPERRASQSRPPAPLAGQDTFFDGKLLAELSVGPLSRPAEAADGEPRRTGGGSHFRPVGSVGGSELGLGGGHGNRGAGGGTHGDGGNTEADLDRRADAPRPMLGRMTPAVLIHLRFTNHGAEPIALEIVDFKSPLGNFAVQPENLKLDPGQSLETEPMSSLLGDSLAETDATLVLRVAGRDEQKVIVLRAVPGSGGAADPSVPPPGN